MRAALLSLCLCVSVVCSALGADLGKPVSGSYGYNAGMKAELPQGNDRFYLTVSVDGRTLRHRSAAVANWFDTDPRLLYLRQATRFNLYETNNPLFVERMLPRVGNNVPLVTLQAANGEVIANFDASTMPASAGELADLLYQAINDRCPCPLPPRPPHVPFGPTPHVNPINPPIGPVGPAIGARLFPYVIGAVFVGIGLIGLMMATGVGAGFFSAFRKAEREGE